MTNYDEEMLFEENEFEFESVKIDLIFHFMILKKTMMEKSL